MALYGGQRDISLFRHVNRELISDIISQECVYYKYKLEEEIVKEIHNYIKVFRYKI